MPIGKVLIANRGEIALRILRSCREMGIATVAVYSTVDRNALHVQLADEAVCVGEGPSNRSYLNVPNILAAATSRGVDAIHPGYGFLAENAEFAAVCRDCHIEFIGPSPEAMGLLGDKISCRAMAKKSGTPIFPGSEGEIEEEDEAVELAESIGFPVIVKAAAGGGGRGMRVVHERSELRGAIQSAQQEARTAFGNGAVYIEKFLQRARHVEVQCIGDKHGNAIHLYNRDCTSQRRHQKLIEEGPAPGVPDEIRDQVCNSAAELIRNANYAGAATCEFLMDPNYDFYMLEVNTRVQVEHPVTEMITGVDIVKESIRVAAGEPLSVKQEDVSLSGHAIECRINAEDARHNFRPAPGRITGWLPPGGPGVRVDSHVYTGYDIPPFYDSLIGKLIVWGKDRDHAMTRMKRALNECAVTGIPTTVEFHLDMLDRPEFINGDVHTKFVEQEMLP